MELYIKKGGIIYYITIISVFCILFFSSGCMRNNEHIYLSKDAAKPANPFQIPYNARSYPNSLEIFKGKNKMCMIKSSGDLIEQWGFIDRGNYVAIRSKESEKQMVLELFKTKTCKLTDKIKLPFPVNKKILPIWAKSILGQ